LETVKKHGLFFVDSRTTAASKGSALARRLKVACVERSVFLDNERDAASIRAAFETVKRIARERGSVVATGHVWCAELAKLLPSLYEQAAAEDYEFVTVSSLASEAAP
jgi:polysaccharide deacetylase 2 family uncharacterized protein YibQ